MAARRRVIVIGLDCGTPELLFDRFADEMPTLSALRSRSLWGPMRSVIPPITVPAWSCMFSGRTPGELGIYGFRNRTDHSYKGLGIATSRSVKVPRIWDMVSAAGRESVVMGVPGTYPPTPIAGSMVSCFLAPSTEADFTHPGDLRAEVQRVTGGYILDVEGFRSEDKAPIAQMLFDMTEQRFALARHLVRTKPWDFFAFVDMGPDRLHHAFWATFDPAHPKHDEGNAYAGLFSEYYRALDQHLAELLACLPDDTTVVLASDHGAQPMLGAFCVNEWLRQEGYLTLAEEPATASPLSSCAVDWTRTAAWAEGGYYGRIFLNVEGREPLGIIPPSEYETVRQGIVDALEALTGPTGQPMGNHIMRPEDVYPEVEGVPPDLIAYFADLRWRAAGTLGLGEGLYTTSNDTGSDDANHAPDGVLMISGDGILPGPRQDISLLDVAPTLQTLLGLSPPPGQRGAVLV